MEDSEKALHTKVAWAYYHESFTQAEIADKYGLTRIKVNRILQQCRDNGMVQIIINSELAGCAGLEWRLEQRWGLYRAIVVPTPEREKHLYGAIGQAAGDYVSNHLREGQALGLGWGTTLRASEAGLKRRTPGSISVVSLFGGLPRSVATNPYELVSDFSRILGAKESYYIAAPMYAASEEVRSTLMNQTMFAELYARAAEVDMALIGAGDLTAKSTNVVLGALTEQEWRSLVEAGAVGEVFGYFIDKAGQPVDHPINRRFMGPALDKLRSIPLTVVASGGRRKVGMLAAVLTGGYADVLVTDEVTAESVLAQSS
mgnify:CR=1 FL=1